LKAFVAVIGSRAPGMRLDRIRKSFFKLTGWAFGHLWKWTPFSGKPSIPVHVPALEPFAERLAKQVKRFGLNLPWVFKKCGTEERFIQAQYLHERLADIAIDLYAASCSLSKLDHLMASGYGKDHVAEVEAGRNFLHIAFRRMDQNFHALFHNDDEATTATANAALARW
jgi:acyl-CoA dehydrogenase family protein 9